MHGARLVPDAQADRTEATSGAPWRVAGRPVLRRGTYASMQRPASSNPLQMIEREPPPPAHAPPTRGRGAPAPDVLASADFRPALPD